MKTTPLVVLDFFRVANALGEQELVFFVHFRARTG